MESGESPFSEQLDKLVMEAKQDLTVEPSPDFVNRVMREVSHTTLPEIETIRKKQDKRVVFLRPAFAVAFAALLGGCPRINPSHIWVQSCPVEDVQR